MLRCTRPSSLKASSPSRVFRLSGVCMQHCQALLKWSQCRKAEAWSLTASVFQQQA